LVKNSKYHKDQKRHVMHPMNRFFPMFSPNVVEKYGAKDWPNHDSSNQLLTKFTI